MKASEMQRYSMFTNVDVWDFKESPDGEWVRHSDAMQVIQALEAKIKGMVDRPKVEVVTHRGYPTVFMNGIGVVSFTSDKGADPDKVNKMCADGTAALINHSLDLEGGADE